MQSGSYRSAIVSAGAHPTRPARTFPSQLGASRLHPRLDSRRTAQGHRSEAPPADAGEAEPSYRRTGEWTATAPQLQPRSQSLPSSKGPRRWRRRIGWARREACGSSGTVGRRPGEARSAHGWRSGATRCSRRRRGPALAPNGPCDMLTQSGGSVRRTITPRRWIAIIEQTRYVLPGVEAEARCASPPWACDEAYPERVGIRSRFVPRHRSPEWDHRSVQVDDRQMSGWRCLYLGPLFFFTVYLAGLGLVLGSWSIQWFAAYVPLFGALVLLGMIGGAAYAISVGRSMRPWMLRYLVTFIAMVAASVISWIITDAVWKPWYAPEASRNAGAAAPALPCKRPVTAIAGRYRPERFRARPRSTGTSFSPWPPVARGQPGAGAFSLVHRQRPRTTPAVRELRGN